MCVWGGGGGGGGDPSLSVTGVALTCHQPSQLIQTPNLPNKLYMALVQLFSAQIQNGGGGGGGGGLILQDHGRLEFVKDQNTCPE